MADASRWLVIPLITLAVAVSTGPRARAGATDELAKLCDDYWQGYLRSNPTTATEIGDQRYDDRLEDLSPAGDDAEQKRFEAALARAQAIDEKQLPPGDQLTRTALILELHNQLDDLACNFKEWDVDPLNGPQVSLLNLPDITQFRTALDATRFVARCRAMGSYMDQHIANLERGLEHGKVASQDQVRRVLEELGGLASQPVDRWALLAPLEAKHDDWTAADREAFARDLTAAVRDSVMPAFARYRDFLVGRVKPAARPQDKAGLSFIPGGREAYQKRIRIETSLDKTPEELHQLGLDEVARIRVALSELGGKVLGTTDIAEIQRKLRTDPAMHFASADEVEAKARATLARSKAAIPKYFGMLPKADCEVKVMGMHEAPNSTIAYYRPCAADGSRPGYYMINTYQPETRPRYEAEALAFHESIPGHHLQIAIAQEISGLPEFRKHQGVTAYVEGWALYTEHLADDMGLYSSDLDRIGMLSFDAWRACRLVVDTGMHAMGWSRQQAIDYMVANTVLAENNIANEVDRYLSDPGQALAYKCGQLEILALREEGRKRLGERFDLKGFHDAVLRNGALALPVLRQQVESYYAQMEAAK